MVWIHKGGVSTEVQCPRFFKTSTKGKVKKKKHKTSDSVWSFETPPPPPTATSDNFWFFLNAFFKTLNAVIQYKMQFNIFKQF